MADETGRSRAFFGRRKGHPLRPQQAALFETLLPRLAIDLTAPPPAPAALFPDLVDDVRLEIGFGGGEHLIAEARSHQHTGRAAQLPRPKGLRDGGRRAAHQKQESAQHSRGNDCKVETFAVALRLGERCPPA